MTKNCYYMHVYANERCKGRKKQPRPYNQQKSKQHKTPKAVTFLKKNKLPRVRFEPTTLHTLDRHVYYYLHTNMHHSVTTHVPLLYWEKIMHHSVTTHVPLLYWEKIMHHSVTTHVPLLYWEKMAHHSSPTPDSLLATMVRIPSNTHSGVTLLHRSGLELPNVVSVVT